MGFCLENKLIDWTGAFSLGEVCCIEELNCSNIFSGTQEDLKEKRPLSGLFSEVVVFDCWYVMFVLSLQVAPLAVFLMPLAMLAPVTAFASKEMSTNTS